MKISDIANYSKIFIKDFYIYAETSFIHEGSENYLLKLIDAARRAKCNGIKFQILLDIDNAYVENSEVYRYLKSWRFDQESWVEILDYAKAKDLDVIAMPIDSRAIRFCMDNIRRIDSVEIHPICFNDYFTLKKLGSLKKTPIILGVSGSTVDEICYALDILGFHRDILLMYGFQTYPTKIEHINLSMLNKLEKLFDLPIGYADHTRFDDPYQNNLIEYAYLLGARIFEKHITLKKGEKRTDFISAIEYEDILELRKRLDRLVIALGKDLKFILNKAEVEYRNRRKQLVYAKNIKIGEKITPRCIAYKVCREKSDFVQKDIHKIIGCKATRNLKKNSVIRFQDIA